MSLECPVYLLCLCLPGGPAQLQFNNVTYGGGLEALINVWTERFGYSSCYQYAVYAVTWWEKPALLQL